MYFYRFIEAVQWSIYPALEDMPIPLSPRLQMFLAMGAGEHISPRHPCVSWYRVRAYRIEPQTPQGRLTVDGELVDYAPIQQHVWRKAANIMCSPAPTSP